MKVMISDRKTHGIKHVTIFMPLSILLCLVFLSNALADTPVRCLVLISSDMEPYRNALNGFQAEIMNLYNGTPPELTVYSTEKSSTVKTVKHIIMTSPDAVITIGTPATELMVSSGISVPVIYCMVLNPSVKIRQAGRFAGILLDIPIKTQIEWFRRIVPGTGNIVILYSPLSEKWVDMAREASLVLHTGIREIEFTDISGLSRLFTDRKEDIDGLMAIPDGSIYNKTISHKIIYLALQKRIPFMGLSRNFTKAGALFSLDRDYEDIGRQAAEMTFRVLNGEPVENIPDERPRKIVPVINMRIARLLGLKIDDETKKQAVIIDR